MSKLKVPQPKHLLRPPTEVIYLTDANTVPIRLLKLLKKRVEQVMPTINEVDDFYIFDLVGKEFMNKLSLSDRRMVATCLANNITFKGFRPSEMDSSIEDLKEDSLK